MSSEATVTMTTATMTDDVDVAVAAADDDEENRMMVMMTRSMLMTTKNNNDDGNDADVERINNGDDECRSFYNDRIK